MEQKAAALLHSLIKNHAFHNGNKRTALVATMTFLWRNDQRLAVTVTDDEVFDLMVGIANNSFPSANHGLADDDLVLAIAWWFRQRLAGLGGKAGGMRVKDFLNACEAAGVPWKVSGSSYVIHNRRSSIRVSRSTRKLDGPVVRQYLKRLGLVDVRVDEFQEGLRPEQGVVRSFRNVLRRLAHA